MLSEMTGFGTNIKHIARLALLAFVLLSAPSPDNFAAAHAAPAFQPGQPIADTASAGDLAAFSQASPPQATPPRDVERSPGGDCAAICSAVTTADEILFAPPPLLLLPQMIEFLYQATDAEFVHLKSIDLSFRRQSRPAS